MLHLLLYSPVASNSEVIAGRFVLQQHCDTSNGFCASEQPCLLLLHACCVT